jgi:hypothetical protein
MTWVLAPLLVGGASTLVAVLARAVERARDAGRPGEARDPRRDPLGRTPMEHPGREPDMRSA